MSNIKAYPSQEIDFRETIIQGKTIYENQHLGMDLRDYFAAKAMQGISSTLSGQEEVIYVRQIAKDSYAMADAMLKERDENPGQ